MGKIKRTLIILLFLCLCGLAIIAIFRQSGQVRLGKGYTYYAPTKHISYWKKGVSTDFDIPPTVLSYINTKAFILVKQKPHIPENDCFTHYDYKHGVDTTYYWLIEKQNNIVIGPKLFPDLLTELEKKKLNNLIPKAQQLRVMK